MAPVIRGAAEARLVGECGGRGAVLWPDGGFDQHAIRAVHFEVWPGQRSIRGVRLDGDDEFDPVLLRETQRGETDIGTAVNEGARGSGHHGRLARLDAPDLLKRLHVAAVEAVPQRTTPSRNLIWRSRAGRGVIPKTRDRTTLARQRSAERLSADNAAACRHSRTMFASTEIARSVGAVESCRFIPQTSLSRRAN